MMKVRIVYKEGTVEAQIFENATEIREYSNRKDAEQCVANYSRLSIVEHVHFID